MDVVLATVLRFGPLYMLALKKSMIEVGPSGFEPESDGPQPSSIDQANLRARDICLHR